MSGESSEETAQVHKAYHLSVNIDFIIVSVLKADFFFLGLQTTSVERFIAQEGKTYLSSGNLFGDFTLKVIGEIDQKKRNAGEWVCVCSTMIRGILESR